MIVLEFVTQDDDFYDRLWTLEGGLCGVFDL